MSSDCHSSSSTSSSKALSCNRCPYSTAVTWTLSVWMCLASWVALSCSVAGDQICEQAQINCAFRSDCGPALQAFHTHCASLLTGPPSTNTSQDPQFLPPQATCPDECAQALIALTASDTGVELMSCNCAGNRQCEQSRARLQVCRARVEPLLRPDAVISCSYAHLRCESHSQCSTALDFFVRHCRSAISGRHCSRRCANSLSVLTRQPHAARLARCECDGNERFACPTIKRNVRSLCGLNETDLTIRPIRPLLQLKESISDESSAIGTDRSHSRSRSSSSVQFDYGNSIEQTPTSNHWKGSPYARLSSTMYLDVLPDAQHLRNSSPSTLSAVYTKLLLLFALYRKYVC